MSTSQRKHPHQKPRELTKALITATTNEGDLIVDPCVGLFCSIRNLPRIKQGVFGLDLLLKNW